MVVGFLIATDDETGYIEIWALMSQKIDKKLLKRKILAHRKLDSCDIIVLE